MIFGCCDLLQFDHDNTKSDDGGTLALHAAVFKKPGLLRLLQGRPGVNLALQDNDGNTPLMTACLHGDVECTTILADTYTTQELLLEDTEGETALDIANEQNHAECAVIALG